MVPVETRSLTFPRFGRIRRTERIQVVRLNVALEDITRYGVNLALRQFAKIGREAMLRKYGGGRSRKWYVVADYDLKLICRAAHELQGFGPLPPGPDTFRSYDARDHLQGMGILIVEVKDSG